MDTAVATDRPAHRDRWIVGIAALVSLLLSPITVIWAVGLGVPVGVAGWVLSRTVWPSARPVWLAAAGVVLGTVPYFAIAVVRMF